MVPHTARTYRPQGIWGYLCPESREQGAPNRGGAGAGREGIRPERRSDLVQVFFTDRSGWPGFQIMIVNWPSWSCTEDAPVSSAT